MKHYPTEVAQKTFERKMLGYDPDEVSDFLTVIAAQMDALLQERNALRDTIKEKELSILEYKERDQVLKVTITSASQMAEKMRGDAEREARLIINDANQKAELITRDAKDSLKKVFAESRIFVDMQNVSNTYLSQSQTLTVVSDFIAQYSPLGLSNVTTKDFGTTGIALGGIKSFRGGKPSFKLTLGFTFSKKGWLINRISIR